MLVGDGATAVAGTNVVDFYTITTAADLGSAAVTDNILVVSGDFATKELLGTALGSGGTYALQAEGAWTAATDSMLVLWDDGSNSYLSSFTGTASDEGAFTSGVALVTLVTFVGITNATTLTVADLGGTINA